jgi:hypothetical protein
MQKRRGLFMDVGSDKTKHVLGSRSMLGLASNLGLTQNTIGFNSRLYFVPGLSVPLQTGPEFLGQNFHVRLLEHCEMITGDILYLNTSACKTRPALLWIM